LLTIVFGIGVEVNPLTQVEVAAVFANLKIQWQMPMTKHVEVVMR
jgi:hypothetical protein